MGKSRTSLEAIEMLSDNENPGAELSAGQSAATAAAATPAPEPTTTTEAESAVPAPAQAEAVAAPAEVVSEPAAVTVSPTEPVAAPDGPAAVEHSDVSEVVEADVEAGEGSTETTAEMEKLMEQYAVTHQAPAEGEIESGQVVAITDTGVVVNLGGKTEGLIPTQESP